MSIFSTITRAAPVRAVATLALLAWMGTAAQAETFKIATLSPDGSSWMNSLRTAGKEVEDATEGRVKFRFYPGGVMGDDWAVMRKMRIRQLHGGVLTTGVFAKIYPDVHVYNLPMVFRDLDEVDAVRERIDPMLMAGLEDKGFVTFGFAEVGMAHAMGKQSIRTIDDAQARKVWTPEGDDASALALRAFGITPIPLTIADVLAGLQTGLIDTVASPPVAAVVLQWHTSLNYVLDLPLMYIYGVFVVSRQSFEQLAAEDRQAVREIMGGAVRDADGRNRADHEATMQVLLDQGLELVQPEMEESRDWQRYADAAAEQWVEDGLVSKEIYEVFNRELQRFRDGGNASVGDD